MKVREIKKEDIKAGAKVIHKVDYNKGDFNTKTIRRIYMDRVFYESNEWDFIDSVKESYLLVEEEPTGIPTFDGDLPQGTKLDSGKLKPTLLLDDMPLAIQEILKVLQFGAEKYSEGNWLKVPNGINRYRNAADRHRLAIDELDGESGLLHLSHEATSVLMLLELKLREIQNAK